MALRSADASRQAAQDFLEALLAVAGVELLPLSAEWPLLQPLCRDHQLVGNTISSHHPDLLQIQLQTLRQLAAVNPAGVLQPFRHPLLAAPPDLHRPLLGQ